MHEKKVIVVGGGPAGLMAAEVLVQSGLQVDLYDAMPSVGRKFLLAGKGGMNLTHSEPAELFFTRYGTRQAHIVPWLRDFGANELRAWARGLGIETFVGTSGRVFPTDMKAAPLLRAWLHRLRNPAHGGPGVQFHMRHRWRGWAADDCSLRFDAPQGEVTVRADAAVLALGGGSWPRLGSDGAWVTQLTTRGMAVVPLRPANCGFDVVGWSEHFISRYAGQPFKTVELSFTDSAGQHFQRKGEFVATATGVEGSLIYAASSLLRDEIELKGEATLYLDLLPDLSADRVFAEVAQPRGSKSLSSHLKSRLGRDGIKTALLYELLGKQAMYDPVQLTAAIKALPLRLVSPRPIAEAISSAGGVSLDALDRDLMAHALPGVFFAGEMLDWEAPTGGYLLTACFASGRRAGEGVLRYLGR